MKMSSIHEMNQKELQEELLKNKNELFNLRFQHVTGQLENPMRMKDVKRDIARIKTAIREKEIAQQEQAIG
ncbi:MAG: 50S ribosomal protein L29 [Clostridiales bacterium]|nr:50S ribosomal protein L29 [Clostridiales bacterium]